MHLSMTSKSIHTCSIGSLCLMYSRTCLKHALKERTDNDCLEHILLNTDLFILKTLPLDRQIGLLRLSFSLIEGTFKTI